MSATRKMTYTIKANKLSQNPMFIKFLNWSGDKYSVELTIKSLEESFTSESDKKAVRETIPNDEYLKDLDGFIKKFRIYMSAAILNKSVSDEFLAWLSNSFKYIQEEVSLYNNNETRSVHIKEPKGRWLEALICYNFIMTFNNFGMDIIKRCPCSKFFAHKGKYAKYCCEECKSKGMKK